METVLFLSQCSTEGPIWRDDLVEIHEVFIQPTRSKASVISDLSGQKFVGKLKLAVKI